MLSILSRTISKTIDKMALYVIAYYRFPKLTLSLRSTRHIVHSQLPTYYRLCLPSASGKEESPNS